jgi:hypothetical protein
MTVTPQELLGLPNEAFDELVNEDIRGTSSTDVWEALRHKEVARRWYNALVSMKRESERQLANYKNDRVVKQVQCLQNPNRDKGKQEYQEWVASKAKWRNGVLRFKTGVEEKIAEAKTYLRLYTASQMTNQERAELTQLLNTYRSAIKEHKAEVLVDSDPSDADEKLWSMVS